MGGCSCSRVSQRSDALKTMNQSLLHVKQPAADSPYTLGADLVKQIHRFRPITEERRVNSLRSSVDCAAMEQQQQQHRAYIFSAKNI